LWKQNSKYWYGTSAGIEEAKSKYWSGFFPLIREAKPECRQNTRQSVIHTLDSPSRRVVIKHIPWASASTSSVDSRRLLARSSTGTIVRVSVSRAFVLPGRPTFSTVERRSGKESRVECGRFYGSTSLQHRVCKAVRSTQELA
jgi:hypothetical protein